MTGLEIVLAVLVTGALGTTVYQTRQNSSLKKKASQEVTIPEEEAISRASAKAKEIILDAKNEALEMKVKSEEALAEQKKDVEEVEKRALVREENLDKRASKLDSREDKIEHKERGVEQAKNDTKRMKLELSTKLETLSGLSREEAEKRVLEKTEKEIEAHIAKKIVDAEAFARDKSDEDAKTIMVDAMQKAAVDYVSEATISTLKIPSEDMKGRIIGKEGRNIKAFERLTGVEVIVDDAPDAITLSCFDPLRREIAVMTMEKLLSDGRIHPGRIEEVLDRVKRDLAKVVKKTGEELAYDAGAVGMPDEIINLLGRFKFRFSYGQSLVKHTKEMIKMGAALSAEVGADVALVKKACLLHDLGKVLTHEVEGAHHHISGQIMRKYKMDEKLVNAVEAHHGDIEAKSIEAVIVYIADAISGVRPGARVENYEEYIKRITELETAAKDIGKEKVKDVFAIHAGREVRVIVKPDVTSDHEAKILAFKISKHIEKTQTYPGTVTVNVIRELREKGVAN